MPSREECSEETFSGDDLIRFVNEQPDHRFVNFAQNHTYSEDNCGCLLIHFGKERLNLGENLSASYDTINVVSGVYGTQGAKVTHKAKGDGIVSHIIYVLVQDRPITYKEVKLKIRGMEEAFRTIRRTSGRWV